MLNNFTYSKFYTKLHLQHLLDPLKQLFYCRVLLSAKIFCVGQTTIQFDKSSILLVTKLKNRILDKITIIATALGNNMPR